MIESPPERGEKQPRRTRVQLPITLEIIPTPPRYTSHILVDRNESKRSVCPERMCGVFQLYLSGLWRPWPMPLRQLQVLCNNVTGSLQKDK